MGGPRWQHPLELRGTTRRRTPAARRARWPGASRRRLPSSRPRRHTRHARHGRPRRGSRAPCAPTTRRRERVAPGQHLVGDHASAQRSHAGWRPRRAAARAPCTAACPSTRRVAVSRAPPGRRPSDLGDAEIEDLRRSRHLRRCARNTFSGFRSRWTRRGGARRPPPRRRRAAIPATRPGGSAPAPLAVSSRSVRPLQPFHHQERAAAGRDAEVVDRDDVRVGEAGRRPRLALEALRRARASPARSSRSTFTATSPPSARSDAAYTVPMPPRPRRQSSR